jgi:hypothetical protein
MIWRRRNKIILILSLISLSLLWATAALAAFVDVGLGARPVGLGRAFVALADDANAMLYNPAGLAHLERMELTSMYARLFPGVENDKLHLGYLGLVKPVGHIGTLGFGFTNLWADLYNENMFYLSYAREVGSGLGLGGNLKLLRWSAEGYTDPETGQSEGGRSWSGFSLDFGLLYALRSEGLLHFTRADGLQLGLALFNINQPSVAENGSDEAKLPLGFEGGIVYLKGGYKSLLSFSRRDDKTRLHLGQEIELWARQSPLGPSTFLIRGGALAMLSDQRGGEFDFGCGFTIRKALFDYVYVFPLALRDVGGCHKISIGYTF